MASKYNDEDEYDEKDEKEEFKSCHADGESKFSENKEPELTGAALVLNVQNYFFTDESLSNTFEQFVKDRCHVINLEDDEYRLEYTQVYIDYKSLFEDRMEDYICNTLQSSIHEFYTALKQSTEDDENSSEAVFGQILLSVTDFDIFMQMMREAKMAADLASKRK